jgi:hypothetical protein
MNTFLIAIPYMWYHYFILTPPPPGNCGLPKKNQSMMSATPEYINWEQLEGREVYNGKNSSSPILYNSNVVII